MGKSDYQQEIQLLLSWSYWVSIPLSNYLCW